MFPIAPLLPGPLRLKIVDVGAMSLGDGTDPYARLSGAVPCDLVGFEPMEGECDKLNRKAMPRSIYLPYVIGDGSEQTFHQCNDPSTSSLLEPNTPLLARFGSLAHLVRVVATRPVATRRLDDIPEARGADFLKVDVQGGELMVFRGAAATLREAVVIHTELEFLPLYKNQPLFADVDAHLRSQGFVLHKFANVGGWIFDYAGTTGNDHPPVSQLLWCDGVYVRDFMAFDRLSPGQLLKIAVILHENYGSYDLAASALEAYDRMSGTRLKARYHECLAQA